ncbi:MAG: FAD-binding oxidoreductase [Bacteriovoracaceae bacterium]
MKKSVSPAWYDQVPPKHSFRSVFKWGALDQFKHPKTELVELLKKTFSMSDDDFKEKSYVGDDIIAHVPKSKLDSKHIRVFEQIVGEENVSIDDYTRVKYGYGKTLHDSLRLRRKIIENLTDAVISPRNKNDVIKIVKYCNDQKIPIYPFGGGSSVTFGVEAVKGGITLNMAAHMNRVLAVNEMNLTCTVEPGIFGPALENELNNAKNNRSTKNNFTCGHFPQSFEYSTVGGWIAAKGAGQASTYYGTIEDLVVCMEWVTPSGIIKTLDFPKAAIGPDIDQMFIGSEGAFGILVEATLKIFHYLPHQRKYFSFVFKDYASGLKATQLIMQSEFYKPSVFRLSDRRDRFWPPSLWCDGYAT